VRTTCYLRDIDRDYDAFNEERTAFSREQGLDPLPASTGIQAHLCRPELLVEIETIAMFLTGEGAVSSKQSLFMADGSNARNA
jgi:enamine deaminase RidA (YjgF/YER057c/UK114 family)